MATILGILRTTSFEIREAGPGSYFPAGSRFLRRLWEYVVRYAVGTGVKQRDRGFQRQYTIAAGATQIIDLSGALADAYGTTVSFPKVCEIRILNHSTTLELSVGPTAGGVGFGIGTWWTLVGDRDIVGVATGDDEPGEYFHSKPAGATVTAGTADKFDITAAAGSGTATVTVQIAGKSA